MGGIQPNNAPWSLRAWLVVVVSSSEQPSGGPAFFVPFVITTFSPSESTWERQDTNSESMIGSVVQSKGLPWLSTDEVVDMDSASNDASVCGLLPLVEEVGSDSDTGNVVDVTSSSS